AFDQVPQGYALAGDQRPGDGGEEHGDDVGQPTPPCRHEHRQHNDQDEQSKGCLAHSPCHLSNIAWMTGPTSRVLDTTVNPMPRSWARRVKYPSRFPSSVTIR